MANFLYCFTCVLLLTALRANPLQLLMKFLDNIRYYMFCFLPDVVNDYLEDIHSNYFDSMYEIQGWITDSCENECNRGWDSHD